MADSVDANWVPDGILTQAAERVLGEAGYAVQVVQIDGIAPLILVADDAYSAVGVATSGAWSSIAEQIDRLQLSFGNWAVELWGAGKRWDLYLAILISSDISADELGDVETVVSDIKYVRKIVRGSVTASLAGVGSALAPFLPVEFTYSEGVADPLAELEQELRGQGIEPSVAAFAIESFRQSGEVTLP